MAEVDRRLGRHPIPDDWHRVGPRSSAKKMNINRRATHPVHAMRNYAYAVLEG
jgi:CRISPR-associated protein Cas1